MEFLLAIIVFGGMLAVCFVGFGAASRNANAMNTTGNFGRRYSEPPPYAKDTAPAHDAHSAAQTAPSQTAATHSTDTTTGEDHPILQTGETKPRAARDKPKMM